MVISAIWPTSSGQNRGPYIRNPVYCFPSLTLASSTGQSVLSSHWLGMDTNGEIGKKLREGRRKGKWGMPPLPQTSSFQSTRVAYSDHSSNPVCGLSMMELVRLCTVWPQENWLGTCKTTYRVGWMIWICYSRALERRCLGLPPLSLPLRAFARPADFKSKIRGLGRSRVGEARTWLELEEVTLVQWVKMKMTQIM